MELRQIKYFVRIAELGSMTRAADALFIAQPALSIQIRNLEEELGTQLFMRHSRGVKLTEAGQAYFESSLRIIAEVDRAKMLLTRHSSPLSDPVRLAINPSADPNLVARILAVAGERCPEVVLSLVEGTSEQISAWLLDNSVNMGLVYYLPSDCAGLQCDPLRHESLMLFSRPGDVRSGGAAATTVSFEDALSMPMILQPRSHPLRREIEAAAAEASLSLKAALEISSVSMVLNLVERGFGATILPAGAARGPASEGRLHARQIVNPRIGIVLSLAYPVNAKRSSSEIVMQRLIREVATEAQT